MTDFNVAARRGGKLARRLLREGASPSDIANGLIAAGLAAWASSRDATEGADFVLKVWAGVRDGYDD